MEFRELQYFLAIAEEGTISAAAESLHVSQPSLSRQMQELETELGKTLFHRGNRRITLTEEGLLLRKRANEMLRLMEKTAQEIASSDRELSGNLLIGAAETDALHFITDAARSLQERSPDVRLHIVSGDTTDTMYQLDQGLIDFALLFYLTDSEKYSIIDLPVCDHWSVLLPEGHPLAGRSSVSFREDLMAQPLIMSRLVRGRLFPGIDTNALNVVATYNLAYSATHMVRDGLGLAVCLDSVISADLRAEDQMVLVPIEDMNVDLRPTLIWKKYQPLSRLSTAFIETLQQLLADA